MGLLKRLSRKVLFPASLAFQIDKLLIARSSHSCCIVNFHGVRNYTGDLFNNRHLASEEFEKLIVYLKQTFDIVPLPTAFDLHRDRRTPKRKTVALTFDDGYQNNFDIALPILKKHNVPATFYVISKCLEQPDYLAWPDMIDLLRKFHKREVVVENHVFNPPHFYSESLRLYLSDYLKTRGINAEKIASGLLEGTDYRQRALSEYRELFQLVSSDELKKYCNEPLLEIGSHSHCHPNMENLTRDETIVELRKSKTLLENTLGKKVISYAFPDGSYNKETLVLAEQEGYSNLVAVTYKFDENNQVPGLLSRFTVSNSTTWQSNAIRLAREFNKFGFN